MRGGLLVVISVLLFVVFLAGNVLWTLDKSLDYEILKPELVSVVTDVIENQINVSEVVGDEFAMMEEYCENNSDYVFTYDESETVIELPCEAVEKGPDAVVDQVVENFVEDVYEGRVAESPFDFSKLNDSIHSYFYLALIVALAMFVLIFFLAEAKSNAFIIVGSLLLISALPLIKIESFFSWIPFDFAEYLIVFFSKASSIFWISFITGLIILAVGIVMKFFGIGFKLHGFFNKFSNQKEVKTVVVKENVALDKFVKSK